MEKLSWPGRFLIRLLALTGLMNIHWNRQLKRNGAMTQRDARPYTQETAG